MKTRERVGSLLNRVQEAQRKARFWRWVSAILTVIIIVGSSLTFVHFQSEHWNDPPAVALAKKWNNQEMETGNPCYEQLAFAIEAVHIRVGDFSGKLMVKQSQRCSHSYIAVAHPDGDNAGDFRVILIVERPGEQPKDEHSQNSMAKSENAWTKQSYVPEGRINARLESPPGSGQFFQLLPEGRPVV